MLRVSLANATWPSVATQVNIGEAKTRLSELVAAAERGDEVVLCKAGRPVVRLVPVADAPEPRFPFDCYRGLATPEELDEVARPLDEDLLAAFEGRRPA